LALRAFRPPVPLEVFECRNSPDYVRGAGRFGGRVVHWAGPWRVRGEWWTEDPFAREYYDVELSDGGVYRIYRDARSGEWAADGVYD
jgi:protein ImuB